MVDVVKTTVRDYNRDLIREELRASALPFTSVFFAGFANLGRFRKTPQARRIRRDGVASTEDNAAAGELRFVFTRALTGAEDTALDTLLTNHNDTGRTAEQSRLEQDDADFTTLENQFSNFDSFDNTQFRNYVKLLARVVIRDKRKSAF